ncbi:unnamed protein product [Closterium sp. Naga37s-1]|nr:unnamed protein product [Closterium sp. Naga37s-1]
MSSRRPALGRLTTACRRLLTSPSHALPSVAARSAICPSHSPSPALPHEYRLLARDIPRLRASAQSQPSFLPPFPPHTRNLSRLSSAPPTSASPDHALLPPPPHSPCALPPATGLPPLLRQFSASAHLSADSEPRSRDSERGGSRDNREIRESAAENLRAEHRRAAEDWREETRRAEEWIRNSGEPPPARDIARRAAAGTSRRGDQRAGSHGPRGGRGSGERSDWGERTSSGGRSDLGERSDRGGRSDWGERRDRAGRSDWGGRSRSGGREQQQHHPKAEAARRTVRHKRILEEEESPSFEKWLQRQGGGSAAREGGGGKQWREKKVRWVAGTYAEMRASHGMRLLNAQRAWMESEDVAMVARHLMHMDGHVARGGGGDAGEGGGGDADAGGHLDVEGDEGEQRGADGESEGEALQQQRQEQGQVQRQQQGQEPGGEQAQEQGQGEGQEEYHGHECALRVLKWGHSMGIYSPATSPREAMLLARHLAGRQRVADMLVLTQMFLAARPAPPVFAEEMLAVLAACVRHKRAADAAAVYSFVRGPVLPLSAAAGASRSVGTGEGARRRFKINMSPLSHPLPHRPCTCCRCLQQPEQAGQLAQCLQQPEQAGALAQVKAHVEEELRVQAEEAGRSRKAEVTFETNQRAQVEEELRVHAKSAGHSRNVGVAEWSH